MPNKNALNGWERNVLWIVLTLLIAGWWGILGVLLKWRLNNGVVWFATLNTVLTIRFIAHIGCKRSPDFNSVFAYAAQITAVWFPIMLLTLPVMLFVGAFITGGLYYLLTLIGLQRVEHDFIVTYALVVSCGTATPALISVFASSRQLVAALDTPTVS